MNLKYLDINVENANKCMTSSQKDFDLYIEKLNEDFEKKIQKTLY